MPNVDVDKSYKVIIYDHYHKIGIMREYGKKRESIDLNIKISDEEADRIQSFVQFRDLKCGG